VDFLLFLLVNIALFLRPQDLVDGFQNMPLYNGLIVANLLVAAPAILSLLGRFPRQTPALVCVFGVLAAIVFSLAARGEFSPAWDSGYEFAKVVAYFVLMTAVLSTPRRLSWYLAAVVALTLSVTSIAALHYHGYLDLPAITQAREAAYDADGSRRELVRLTAYGVFADPNDLSMIVVLSMFICLGGLFYRRLGPPRFAIIAPLMALGYGLALTQSRGGLLALLVGLLALLVNSYGLSRSLPLAAVLLPGVLVLFAGRQADFSGGISHGTGSQRTDLWYAGLQMFKWYPLQGRGHGHFVEEEGLVAHNSYVQALAEWGIFGGTMFIGLFYLVLHSVWRLRKIRGQIAAPVLSSFQPYIVGALAAYTVSMMTLTRCDAVPTYLVAGLGVSFERLAVRHTPLRPVEFTPRLLGRMLAATLGFLALLYVYIRFIFRMF
jgi:O-antigen ligase